jgi:hypothetical protein
MAFYRGQKVTMKRNGVWQKGPNVTLICPEFGAVYTVREIITDDYGIWLLFYELKNPPVDGEEGMREPAFGAKHFRPLVERKTDIGFAHEILRRATKRQGADA